MTQQLVTPSANHPIQVTLAILDSARPPTVADLAVVVLTKSARLKRALRHLAAVWGGAALAIAVPLLHFILVPLLFLAGPVVAVRAFRARVRADAKTSIGCPKCAALVSLESPRYGWPLRFDCRECGVGFTASPRS
jgi:hypothetical protein